MDFQTVLHRVNQVFIDVLDEEGIILTENTTADDVMEWDSLTHVQLVAAVEKHFQIQFTRREVSGFQNVGEMCRAIQAHLEKRGQL